MRTVTLLAFAALALACGPNRPMAATTRAPSTNGWFAIGKDTNDNTRVKIRVEHMPPATRLGEGLTTYIVWIATTDRRVSVNAGQLKVSESQSAEMETLTPLNSFSLFITAERSTDVMVPGPTIVLEASVTGT
jgi:hypothetical protein